MAQTAKNSRETPVPKEPIVHAKPMLLSDKLKQLQRELRDIEGQIESCQHDWTETSVLTVEMETTRTEATGGIPYFGRVQQRTCGKCGLKQERIQHDPRMQWTDWKKPTIYFA